MKKIYNFSSSPTTLPQQVVEKLNSQLFNYNGTGLSVLEISSTSELGAEIVNSAKKSLRELLNIPQNYKILFMQGDASAQFSAIPLNILSERKYADYIVTGIYSNRARQEAKKYADVAEAASSGGANPIFSTIPYTQKSDFRPDSDYVHICYNNTLYGTKYYYIPDTGNIPLVADMSSYILSCPIDVTKFALIYAGVENNICPGDMTVVIIRDDLLGGGRKDVPGVMNYNLVAESDEIYSATSLFTIYLAKLTFDWITEVGGLEEMKRRNERKASLIYDYLDRQSYYTSPVDKKCRSYTNIVFFTGDANLDSLFIRRAAEEGLINLAGYTTIGGMRASLPNSMPYEGVEALVGFMKKFAQENPKLEM